MRQGARLGGQARPHPRGQVEAPLTWILLPVFFIYSKIILRWFSGHSENFYFCPKITPWQFCWKQRQSGLIPFKSCKLESKPRAKEFGKVDTMESINSPKLNPLLVIKQFSWQTESDKEKTFTNSIWSCYCKYVKPTFKFSAKIMK